MQYIVFPIYLCMYSTKSLYVYLLWCVSVRKRSENNKCTKGKSSNVKSGLSVLRKTNEGQRVSEIEIKVFVIMHEACRPGFLKIGIMGVSRVAEPQLAYPPASCIFLLQFINIMHVLASRISLKTPHLFLYVN